MIGDSETRPPEVAAVAERYGRRNPGSLYSVFRPEVVSWTQELQREILSVFGSVCGYTESDLRRLKLVDVGCGYGSHLLDFLRMGLEPQNLYGIELLPHRVAEARSRLPEALMVHEGDASTAALTPASQDVVFQSLVFSSLLDEAFQQELADQMWSWVRPGGGILWYDFVYDNPSNRDVRGVRVSRMRELFPLGRLTVRRVTLAPPISRRVCRIHPAAYGLLNALPFLRSHVLCWIEKP